MSDNAVIDFSKHANAGLENISNQDLQVPFLQIAQSNSPEVDKASSEYETKGISGASAGDVFDTVSRQVVAPFGEPVSVIPIAYDKAYVEWVPREEGGGMVTMHKDPSILSECTKNDKYKDILPNGNIIETTAYHYILYGNDDNWTQAIISMQSTQLKKSRAWLSKISSIKMSKDDGTVYTPPMFSHSYNLSSATESNKYGSWFGWKIEIDGALKDPNAYNYALASREKTMLTLEGSAEPF
jgi:hypothetical protein